MRGLHLDTDIGGDIDDLCALAMAPGRREGVEASRLPVKSEIVDGRLRQRVEGGGRMKGVVTGAGGGRFSESWLDLVTRELVTREKVFG